MKWFSILLLGLVLLSGCGPSPEQIATRTAAASTAMVASWTPTPTPEVYEKIDPSVIRVAGEASLQSLTVDAGGGVHSVEGTISSLSLNGVIIDLASDQFIMEGSEAFIETKDYGRYKVTFTSTGVMTLWLKPSQVAQILEAEE